MAKCQRQDFVFRLWPPISVTALRRRLIQVLACGGSSNSKKTSAFYSPSTLTKLRQQQQQTKNSDHLAVLLKAEASSISSSSSSEAEVKRKTEAFKELKRVVESLQSNSGDDQCCAAVIEIRKLAKDDSEARETLAMLGAIPPLVGFLDFSDPELHAASLYALLNLSIGNDSNKAAIMKAGAVHKMLRLMDLGCLAAVSDAIVANLLGLSALDANKPIIGSSGSIPFLLSAFKKSTTLQPKVDALCALFNLSISPSNTKKLLDAGTVELLFSVIGDMEVSDRSLLILSNIACSPEGRREVIRAAESIPILIDVLSWCDSPGCQEKAVYILMVIAHKSYGDRTAMVAAGAISALLELALIGTQLAQKRASRLLESLRADKGKQVSEGFAGRVSNAHNAVSAPQQFNEVEVEIDEGGGGSNGDHMISEERRAVRRLVQQSLQSNMRRIAKRANLPENFAPSDRLIAVTASSTSKSLAF